MPVCESFEITEKQFEQVWAFMPLADRRFISTLSLVSEVIDDDKLRYRELPIEIQLFIASTDRGTCFSLLAECLAALLGTSVMDRVKNRHRQQQRSRQRSRRHSRIDPKDADDCTRGDSSGGEDVSASEADARGDARNHTP